ncbi:MAG: hypothetical protein ABSG76_17600 [Xanthobacteraceae bacterium]|jgi:hypothetical protein
MRNKFAVVLLAAATLNAASASAEIRTFIIANNADGYGVDRCLATGANCGVAVAAAYCRSQEFAEAQSFRKIARDEITGASAGSTACLGSCNEFVAIECRR